MKTIEEILTCVESCMAADICDDARHWCSYGDTDPSTCVDRLETDYQAILDVVKKVESLDRLTEICAAERDGRLVIRPDCRTCAHRSLIKYHSQCFGCLGQDRFGMEKGNNYQPRTKAEAALAALKGE